MKLVSYKGNQKGFPNFYNILIRWRTDSVYSHNEVVFEPGDGVDHLMPDGTTEPDVNGAVWMASTSIADIIPKHSPYRAGQRGGMRFKRIVLHPEKWDVVEYPQDPVKAATYFKENQGNPYDHSLIAGYIVWFLNLLIRKSYLKIIHAIYKRPPSICSQVCLTWAGYDQAHSYTPGQTHDIVANLSKTDISV